MDLDVVEATVEHAESSSSKLSDREPTTLAGERSQPLADVRNVIGDVEG